MPRPWEVIGSRPILTLPICTIRSDRCVAPSTGEAHERLVIEAPDWINVVALTPERRVLLVRQWRFGVQRATVELPGGMVDPGETPLEAAARELREETGFVSARWSALGAIEPNPAIQTNLCHSFLAQDCTQAGPLEPDATEELELLTATEQEVEAMLRDGRIAHALVAVAWMKYRATGS